MPCYLDTIVKIKHVKQNETKDAKSISVWAIGMYPTGLENNEIEIGLYVPCNRDDQDHDSQAMFRRDEYYSVSRKIVPNRYAGCVKPKMSVATSTHLTIAGRALESNKCPLKVSLIGSAQGNPTAIDIDNSVIEMIITDYISRDYEYMIYIVFSHNNPRFEHLKTNTQLQDSTIFVVGQMENITKNLKETSVIQIPMLTALSNIESVLSVKRKRSEETSELINVDFINNNDDYKSETNEASSIKADQEEPEDLLCHTTVEDDKSDKE
ncbi:hypothetical protein C2G38_2190154 [Gigaspora rosea]|uniref:Uncharacterized protein n=1 Tax=Gigaspora rosea TaxID=44941 RepID=A0A397V1G0_9GLOM|nr:hypothetical protein C2G38_2190154 [Gigaspora rosea]